MDDPTNHLRNHQHPAPRQGGDPTVIDSLLGALFDSPVGLALFDDEERLRWCNPAYEAAFELPAGHRPDWESLMRECYRERRGLLIDTNDIDAWISRVRSGFRKSPLRSFEADMVGGRWLRVVETLRPDGWMLVQMTDVTSLKANERTLRHLHDKAVHASLTDALTDLPNRRHILEHLERSLAVSDPQAMPLSVAVVDLDHFKRINDQNGHAMGDQVLQHFANMLRRQLRPHDRAGRLGGEEFLVVFQNTLPDGADLAMRRLGQALSTSSGPWPVFSFSAGITSAGLGERSATVLARADRALYQAKGDGRACNRVLAFADEVAPPDLP